MATMTNAILLQGCTLADIERMINRAVGERMNAFYDNIKENHPVLIRRKDAAVMMGISLPTLDQYSKHGIIRAKHIGGRVFYEETEIIKYKKVKK